MNLGAPLSQNGKTAKKIDKRMNQERRLIGNCFEKNKEARGVESGYANTVSCLLPLRSGRPLRLVETLGGLNGLCLKNEKSSSFGGGKKGRLNESANASDQ